MRHPLPNHKQRFNDKDNMWYRLNNKKEPVECDLMTFSQWAECNPNARVVAQEVVGEASLSTVFLGLDHNYSNEGPPILFESMIFGGKTDGYMKRYSTYNEALEGHKVILRALKNE